MIQSENYLISVKGLLKIFIAAFILMAVYWAHSLLITLLVSVVVSMILRPAVTWLEKFKIPRMLGIIFLLLLIAGIWTTLISLFSPLLKSQFKDLIANLPDVWIFLQTWLVKIHNQFGLVNLSVADLQDKAVDFFDNQANNIFKLIGLLFSGLIYLIVFLMSVIVISAQKDIWQKMASWFGEKSSVVENILQKSEDRLSKWVEAELILCLAIFILVWIVLSILGVKHALILAILAGVLEFVPYLGPGLTAVIVGLFVLVNEPIKLIITMACLYLVQFGENHFLVPQVMSKKIDLNPLAVVLAIIFCVKLFGIFGTILGVPLLVIAENIFEAIKNNFSFSFKKELL